MKKTFLTITLGATLIAGGGVAMDVADDPYVDKGTHYEVAVKENAVEIDKTTNEVTLPRWGGEENIKVKAVGSYVPFEKDTLADTLKAESVDGKTATLITANEEGIEIDTILYEKPNTNVFSYEIEGHEDLDFFYQPPQNEQTQPDNVTCTRLECRDADGRLVTQSYEHTIGSYAVYHKTKKDNYEALGGKNYQTGKLYHIYRPKVIDDNGQETWGELNFNQGVLSVTVPQDFLDKAEYPVLVDPTFGYTTIATANGDFNQVPQCFEATHTETGDVVTITSYNNVTFGQFDVSHALYSQTGSDVGTLYAEDGGATTVTVTGLNTTSVESSALTAGDYYVCRWANGGNSFTYYDSGAADQDKIDTAASWRTWPDGTWSTVFSLARIGTVYATYNVAGGGGAAPVGDSVIIFD